MVCVLNVTTLVYGDKNTLEQMTTCVGLHVKKRCRVKEGKRRKEFKRYKKENTGTVFAAVSPSCRVLRFIHLNVKYLIVVLKIKCIHIYPYH